jgi:hypothetical protein
MSTLSPKGQALIRARAQAYQPTHADRERVLGALRVRLGEAALPPDPGSLAIARSATRSLWRVFSAVVVGVGVVGGTLFLAQRERSDRPQAKLEVPMGAPAPAAEPAPAPVEPPEPLETTPSAAWIAPAQASAQASAPKERLAAEVALLARATRDLRAGRPADAIKILDEYRRRFPKGRLGEQHQAGRAQTLCALGRFKEGKAKLAELPPRSPLAVRAQEFCDAALAAR